MANVKEEEGTRHETQFLLASLVTAYPDDTFGEYVGTLITDPDLVIPEKLRNRLREVLTEDELLDDLRSEYIDTFDRGRAANPLYETEYGRDRALVKGSELADLAGFYKAFGLEFGTDGVSREMLDHISVELEFYTLLLLKQGALTEAGDAEGVGVVTDARRKFLADHLGRFPAAIAERPGVAASDHYSMVFGWCRDLVREECTRLGVEVVPAGWIAGQSETETMLCGSIMGESQRSSACASVGCNTK